MQQQQKKLGEEFELVIGVGLLTHVDEQNKSVRRHLLTQKAELSFNSERGLFVVKSHPTDGRTRGLGSNFSCPAASAGSDFGKRPKRFGGLSGTLT